MVLIEWVKEINAKRIVEETVRVIVLFLLIIVASNLGLGRFLRLTGSPRAELIATVNCQGREVPFCAHEGVNVLKSLCHDINDLSDYYNSLSIVHPNDIGVVLRTRSMYSIELTNEGDKEATATATIPHNIYSEVIREVGKGDPNAPEEHFMPKDIDLGPIDSGRTIDIRAWVSRQPNRRRAKEIKISCASGRLASLRIETPVRKCMKLVNTHFWETIALTPPVLLIFHLFIRRRRRKIIGSNTPKPQRE